MQLDGLLFFPVTPFGTDGIDRSRLADHIEQRLEHRPGAVFAACGTGELAALSVEEHAQVVATAVDVVSGRVPVVAGAGGSLPHACRQARAAAEAGADGILVLPPYLAVGPPEGLVGYVGAVAGAAGLPAIAYQRERARFTPESVLGLARHPGIIGLKDGLGDLDLLQRQVVATRAAGHHDFLYFNGLPTAELTMPAYQGLGVELYSSAVFAFLPEVALAFFEALAKGDTALVGRLLEGFYAPLVELRNQVPGYAVALIKAGVTLRGLDVGGVRLPLIDPTPAHRNELALLIEVGLGLIGG